MKRALIALLLAVAIPYQVEAASVAKTYSYFRIGGSTLDEIEAELGRRGPQVNSSGKRHPGATQMEFTTRLGYAEGGGRCRVVSAAVTVKAKLILPRWAARKRADREVRIFWNTLSSDIKRHEESHVSIAKNHARELEEELMGLWPQTSCSLIAAKVKATTDALLERHDRAQDQFDAIEGRNFENRILRLLRYRLEQIDAGRLTD